MQRYVLAACSSCFRAHFGLVHVVLLWPTLFLTMKKEKQATQSKKRSTSEDKDKKQDKAFMQGASVRHKIDRSDLAEWKPKLRKRTPIDLLNASTKGRVLPLVKLKNERMACSPFTYFRGAAPVMAYDLSLSVHTGIATQLCGDAHVENFGAYDGGDGRLIFDLNDFDETIRGPFEWDIKRMTTSILLASGPAQEVDRGGKHAAKAFLESYCDLMIGLSKLPVLQIARFQVKRLGAVGPVSKILGAAERSTPLHSRDQLTEITKGGKRVFRNHPPVLRRASGEEKAAVLSSLKAYRRSLAPERQHFLSLFEPVDVAFKVVGTGSVGLRDYCVLLTGNGPDDPLFLQIKEETSSAYTSYLPKKAVAEKHNGRRVVDGQRAMQLQSDPMLGWMAIAGRDYLVRQLNDHKATLDATKLDPSALAEYALVCGEMLACGHARAGDARTITGYLGGGKRFQQAMLEFATAYAEQTIDDWKDFLKQVPTKKR